jgi:predicted ATPase/class 3 adenylate cyclase
MLLRTPRVVSSPSGTVTFLFTDIEGSTKRWELYPKQMKATLHRHDTLLRSAIEKHNGYIFKTMGDAFCAAFASPNDAIQAALGAQDTLHKEVWLKEIGTVKVRAALHTGIAEERDGDYFGPPVNRVARLLSAGHGGQTLVSLSTYELVRDQLPPGVELLHMGERRLKDLFRPEHVYQFLVSGLPSQFPPLRTLDARPNNLPVQPNPLIGREKEVREVAAMFRRSDVRLLTLTGPGGTGKTRLGLQVAADMVDEFNDGAMFVNLAPIIDAGLVVSTIVQVLGVQEVGGTPLIETLKANLKEKEMLLVLDNFEQVTEAAPHVANLLSASPRLKVLITSRELLQVRGEHNYSVPSLDLPDRNQLPPLERLTQYEAVRLFIERATAVKPDFTVTNDNAPAVAEICHRLDGLPLGIELAAARIKVLPPQAMLSRLESRLKMLTGGARDLPRRQQTLRGAIEWSYDLLDEGEKQLFRRLAVFQGGRTLEAIEVVCNAEGNLLVDVLEGVESLVSKSLLRQEEGVGGEPRFVMLETIHEYAREKLEECGEGEELKRRLAEYFLPLASRAHASLDTSEEAMWLPRLWQEYDNLRAVLAWSLTPNGDVQIGLRLMLSLDWDHQGLYTEGSNWLAAILAVPNAGPRTEVRMRVVTGAAWYSRMLGDLKSARRYYDEALSIVTELGDRAFEGRLLNQVGTLALDEGQYELARQLYTESLQLRRETGNADGEASILNNLGELDRILGNHAEARELIKASITIRRTIGQPVIVEEINLACVTCHLGDIDAAARYLVQGLATERTSGRGTSPHLIATWLAAWVGLACAEGKSLRVARLSGVVDALLKAMRVHLERPDRAEYVRNVVVARRQITRAEWEAAWEEGHAMSIEQAIEYAMEERIRSDPNDPL